MAIQIANCGNDSKRPTRGDNNFRIGSPTLNQLHVNESKTGRRPMAPRTSLKISVCPHERSQPISWWQAVHTAIEEVGPERPVFLTRANLLKPSVVEPTVVEICLRP